MQPLPAAGASFILDGIGAALHYYQHNIGDYARDTGHLTVLEHGIYRLLLDWCYLNEKPLTTEQAIRVSRGNPEETQSVLSEFFLQNSDGWTHKRVMKEVDAYHAKSEVNRQNGAKGGRPKPKNNPVGSQVVAKDNPNHEPLTTNHKPRTINQEPEDKTNTIFGAPHEGATPDVVEVQPAKAQRAKKPPKEPAPTAETWNAYAQAYRQRYRVDPVRNATVNGQLAQLVNRLGSDDAPGVAAWFIGHRHQFYVSTGHSVGILLRDCEKLRTEWATGRATTMTQAMQQDKTQTNFSVFDKLRQEAAIERERLNGNR